mmetsp:Transcript_25412/g.29943  ORF Transcript_25412/g.29943 Transcript_25412/m.29943 type:complete len:111 (-) Transcript_25412:246-578(-)|eukprot:CAMPEP_0198274988 /NCGR_PEP_ID=MMETSP1447-20131203/62689_1 /TAXON_ID=420782 /ORGANISM="Chaetoceros dichaeta, Strain CCMP1751" /LENGTH=110 /DNA_ID=CAMNT_0043969525 /DNA_START=237 /DNA_END=569 /DNA_ORIENTATION=+
MQLARDPNRKESMALGFQYVDLHVIDGLSNRQAVTQSHGGLLGMFPEAQRISSDVLCAILERNVDGGFGRTVKIIEPGTGETLSEVFQAVCCKSFTAAENLPHRAIGIIR